MRFWDELQKVRGFLTVSESKLLFRLALKALERFGEQSIFCEIGSFCGKSTVAIAKALETSKKGRLYAVDWHSGSPEFPGYEMGTFKSTYEEYLENLRRFGVTDRVTTIKQKSEDSLDLVPKAINYLWIDGLHEQEQVKWEILSYGSRLTPNGYLLLHDACWTSCPGPFLAIRELLLTNPDYTLLTIADHTMVFIKAPNTRSPLLITILEQLAISAIKKTGSPWRRILSAACAKACNLHSSLLLRATSTVVERPPLDEPKTCV